MTEPKQEGNPGDGQPKTDPKPNPGDAGKEKEGNVTDPAGQEDVTKLPDWAQKVIKDLRSENAQHRTKSNSLSTRLDQIEKGLKTMFGGEEDKSTPEEKINALVGEKEGLEIRNSMLEIAMANGIGHDDFDFFEFQMKKKFDSMKDNEELSEDDLAEIIGKCRVNSGKKGNTSPKGAPKGDADPANNNSEVTIEQFAKMTIMEKTRLFQEKPELYNTLLNQAKSKGVF